METTVLKRIIHCLVFALIFLNVNSGLLAQNSVSIGTNEINENAVLRLVSPENNQGFLMPKLTSVQRGSMNLGVNDNGMLVYDTDMQLFYYWHGDQWYPLLSNMVQLNLIGGGATSIAGSFPDLIIYTNPNDTSPTNEIQDLYYDGHSLSITGNPSAASIELSGFMDNTDNQQLFLENNVLSISGGNMVNLETTGSDDQKLELSGNSLSIEDGNTVNLSDFMDNTDDQYLMLSGNDLSIINGNTVDLAGFMDNTDNQEISLNNDSLFISGGNSVDLSTVNTDDQLLSLSGNNLSIEDGNLVDLSGFIDNTDNQTLSLNNTNLSISAGNTIDIGTINTDDQVLSFTATELSISGGNTVDLSGLLDDADADTANEIITYGEIIDDELVIAEGDDTTRIDISSLQDSFTGWNINGNEGTSPAYNYIGTSDITDLSIRTGGTERIRINSYDGNVGIGTASPEEKLHVDGSIRANQNIQIGGDGYIDDDSNYGGLGDDWIKFSGLIEMRSAMDNYGIVMRSSNSLNFLNINQVNGYSYFSDSDVSNNYFLRGDGGNVHVRQNLTTGQAITSGNNFNITSGDQFLYSSPQTRYKVLTPADLNRGSINIDADNRIYSYNFTGIGLVPLDLPDGALINNVLVYVYDGDGVPIDNNITARICLQRYSDSQFFTASAAQSTTGSPGRRTFVFNFASPGYNIVSNIYGYFIYLNFSDNADHYFYGARVTYTVQRAD
ncbi:MAG: hypothetical protein JXB49_17525 [Bacteroidales bacterium]|nr:hypothetical protein [Bacteroidales bacterium]